MRNLPTEAGDRADARGRVRVWCCPRGHAFFPRRLICPVCRASRFDPWPVHDGTVEDVTFAPATGVRIVTVRVPQGPRLMGRIARAVRPGDRVVLASDPHVPGAVYVPDPETALVEEESP